MIKKVLIMFTLVLLVGCNETAPKDIDIDPIVDPIGDPIGDPSELTSGCENIEIIGDWEPVWCDEFNYIGLPDTSKWSYDVGGSGWGNGESQYYTSADEDNVYVEDGLLTITAIKENYQSNNYTSTRLVTKNNGDWLYGKIQIRAKLPSGTGTWPAIWMLPTGWEYGGWPTSGEIDIMEYVGYDPNIVHSTIHTEEYNHMKGTQVGESIVVSNPETEFHVYEIEWEPGVIRSYVDGNIYATFEYNPDDNRSIDSYEAWPFDKEFHLILNIAIGGGWGGQEGIDDTIFPQTFDIDYVRVYQKDYTGMDMSNPQEITKLEMTSSSRNSIFVQWDKAIDDIMIKEYEIYVDDVLLTTTTVNGHLINDLSTETEYNIKVIAVDFANNKTIGTSINASTKPPQSISSRVEAEDYSDMSGIQTEVTEDIGGGFNVGWTSVGDWLEYDLVVTESGNYNLEARISSNSVIGEFIVLQDGVELTRLNLPITGGWQNWETISSPEFSLTYGSYTFKIQVVKEGFNLNYIEFKKVD